MRSILYNLIANAVKFRSEKAPVITISTFQERNYDVLTVNDNGKGISAHGLPKIFDMYGRLHQDIEGSGIGLYLKKKSLMRQAEILLLKANPEKEQNLSSI